MTANDWPAQADFALQPRFTGPSTFMRLPLRDGAQGRPGSAGLDIALIGVPWDGGTTNRPGARHGPRAIREMSAMIRAVHPTSATMPFALARCADVGDAPVNPLDLEQSLRTIAGFCETLFRAGARPLVAGGDHLTSLPVLRALAKTHGPVALVHVDAHSDTAARYFGESLYAHGTPFRRAVEEGLILPEHSVQIGLRGSLSTPQDFDFARENGMRLIPMDEIMTQGLDAAITEARRVAGHHRVYVSFDVDALDPAFAPGTGTPEIGGLTTAQAQALLRGLLGLDVIGGDVVEVSPPFDVAGITALAAANLMFEILCLMAETLTRRDSAA